MMARLARARGHLEAVAGRPDAADEAFTHSLQAIDGLHLPFEQARIELATGRFLRRTGQRRRAADLLAAAERRFRTLGASPTPTGVPPNWPHPGWPRRSGSATTVAA